MNSSTADDVHQPRVILSAIGKDKYGRTLATVILTMPVETCRAGEVGDRGQVKHGIRDTDYPRESFVVPDGTW